MPTEYDYPAEAKQVHVLLVPGYHMHAILDSTMEEKWDINVK